MGWYYQYFEYLKTGLHELQELILIIIVRAFFCNLKTLIIAIELLPKAIPYFIIELKYA